jgi:hypothetical protein
VLTRRELLASVSLLVLTKSADAAFAVFQTSIPSGAASFSIMNVGPGGNIIGINFADDGTGVCRTDTGCCYVNTIANPIWQLLINLTTLGAAGGSELLGNAPGSIASGGTYGAVVSPSNSQIIYIFTVNGAIFVSTNQGTTFSATGFTPVSISVNSQSDNTSNDRMAVDPASPNIIVAAWNGGIQYNLTSGAGSWTNVNAATRSGTFTGLVCFDRSSAVVSGQTQTVYLGVYGTGVYRSTTGVTGAFTLLSSAGMPTQPFAMACDKTNGTLYVTPWSNTGNISVWSGSSWASANAFQGGTPSDFIRCVAPDPNTAGRAIAAYSTGLVSETVNSGVAWTGITPLNITAQAVNRVTPADVIWLGTTTHATMAGSGGYFNPARTNVYQMGDGVSSWQINPYIMTSTQSLTIGATGNVTFPITLTQATAINPIAGDGINGFSAANGANNFFGAVVSCTGTGLSRSLVVNVTGGNGSGTHTDWNIRSTPFWTSQGAGVNQLNNNRIVVPPGGSPFLCCWDRCGFLLTSPTIAPSNQAFVATTPEIIAGWDADYSATLTTFMAGIFDFALDGGNTSGFTTNGGATWTAFSSLTPNAEGDGGGIAVAAQTSVVTSAQNICWFPTQGFNTGNCTPYYTTNSGTAWNTCTFPTTGTGAVPIALAIASGVYNSATGVISLTMSASVSFSSGPTYSLNALTGTGTNLAALQGAWVVLTAVGTSVTLQGPTGQGAITITGGNLWTNATSSSGWSVDPVTNSYNPKVVTADRVALNTFYAVNTVTSFAYKSTNSGQTWTTQGTAVVPIFGGSVPPTPFLKSVPQIGSQNTAGWLMLAGIGLSPQTGCFVLSTNGGTSWSAIDSLFTIVVAFGFGASVNGVTPACLAIGIRNGVRGLFLSTDSLYASWKNVTGQFNSGDQIVDLDGDKGTAGTWYIATFSTGIYKGVNIS